MAQQPEPTTLNTIAAAMERTVNELGGDAAAAFERAGLDRSLIGIPGARYPASGMVQLWRTIAEMTGEATVGLQVAARIQPGDWHALGLSMMASASLRDGMQRFARYSRIVSDAVGFYIQYQKREVKISVHPKAGLALTPEALDSVTATVERLRRLLLDGTELWDGRSDLLRVQLVRPMPEDPSPWEDFFRAPIVFDSPSCSLHYEATGFNDPLPGANPQLAQLNEQAVIQYLAELPYTPFIAQVRNLITTHLPGRNIQQQDIAALLHISPRTLQRKLKAENTSFRSLLDETRRTLAGQLLLRPEQTIKDVHYLLGFNDQSNFHHAFKRWFGCTPGQYRMKNNGGGEAASE